MSPEIFASLESFAARRTRKRSVGGMDSFVQSHGGRVLEALAAVTTLTLVEVAVTIEIVLLEVDAQLEPDIALFTAVRTLLSARVQNS